MARRRPYVRFIAPARWAAPGTLQKADDILSSMSMGAKTDIRAEHGRHQLAGEDKERASSLIDALSDPDTDIIWCVRGGYGAARIFPYLGNLRVSHPKWLVGYSDITGLQLGWPVDDLRYLHGPMPVDLLKPTGSTNFQFAAEFLREIFAEKIIPSAEQKLLPVAKGNASGQVITGNLSVLTKLIGTPWEPRWSKVILCLEDISEYLYAIDRHFVHLAQSRLAPAIAGIVLGDFSDLEDNEIPWGESVEEIAARHFPGIPIAKGLPVGHGSRNIPMCQGIKGDLAISETSAALHMAAEHWPERRAST